MSSCPDQVIAGTAAAGSPVTRRSFLGTGTLLTLGTLLAGLPSLTHRPAVAAPRPSVAPNDPRVGDSPPPAPGPLWLQASCELSEDYFFTDDVLLEASDEIIPFTNAAGAVEALVHASGKLAHLRRDPTATSGWAYTLIPDLNNVLTAAVSTDVHGQVTLMCCSPGTGIDYNVQFLAVNAAGVWRPLTSQTVPLAIATVHSALSQDGSTYFWMIDTSDVITIWAAGGPTWTRTQIDSLTGSRFSDALVLWNPSGTGGSVLGITADNQLCQYPQTGMWTYGAASTTDDATALFWAGWAPPAADTSDPLFVYQAPDGYLRFVLEGTREVELDFTGETVADGQLAVWVQNDLYAVSYLDGDVVTIASQYGDPTTDSLFTDSIPLQPGLSRVYSQPSDPRQATLFVVTDALTLAVLEKDLTTGWSLTPIHQDGTSLQKVSGWRTQISVLDTDAVAVGGATISVTAGRPVGVWQPSGNTQLNTAPVTLTADAAGRVTFTIPVTELDTATVTAQALDGDGNQTGNPFTVVPDIDVRNFLAGQGSLTDIGQLNGPALLSATNPDDTPLLPTLTKLPAGQQGPAAAAVAAGLTHLGSLGQGFSPSTTSDPRSAMLDLSGSVPTFATSTDPDAFTGVADGAGDWWDTAKNDAASVFHALRHAAVTTRTLVSRWDDNAKQWVVNLVLDIGDDVEAAVTWTVATMHDAIHAISNIFHVLGADLDAAWTWMEHHVLALLKAADANAKVMEGWLGQVGDILLGYVEGLDPFSPDFFTTLGANGVVHDAIAELTTHGWTTEKFGDTPIPAPTSYTGSSVIDALAAGLEDMSRLKDYTGGAWLVDKIIAYLPHLDSNGGPKPSTAISGLIADAETLADQQAAAALNLGQAITTTFEAFQTRGGFENTLITDFLTALETLAQTALPLADAYINHLIAQAKAVLASIDNVLGYEIASVPFLDQIFSLADIKPIPTLTIQRLITMLAAFPATLVARTMTTETVPTTGVGAPHSALSDPWGFWLNLFSFGLQSVSSVSGLYEDAATGGAPAWTTYLDIASPLLLGILQWPGKPQAGKTAPPFSARNIDGTDGDLITTFQLLGVGPSTTAVFGYFVGQQNSNSPFVTDIVPSANSLFGLGGIIITSLWNWATSQTSNAKTIGIAGGIPSLLAPLDIPNVIIATKFVSAIIKAVADAGANVATTVKYVAVAADAT